MPLLSFWGWCCWYNDQKSDPKTTDRVLYALLIIATLVFFPFMFIFWSVALIYLCAKHTAIKENAKNRLPSNQVGNKE